MSSFKRTFSFQMGDTSGTYSRVSFRLNLLKIASVLLFGFVCLMIGYYLGKCNPEKPEIAASERILLEYTTEIPSEQSTVASTPSSTVMQTEEDTLKARRDMIKNIATILWVNLMSEVSPDSQPGSSSLLDYAYRVSQALSSLWIMDLREEFDQGREWIRIHVDLKKIDQALPVFAVVTEYIGPMLSCYALTGDKLFLVKAQDAIKLLKPAFKSEGLPYPYSTRIGTRLFLGEAAGQHLELRFLSDLAKDAEILASISKTRTFLRALEKPQGLYQSAISANKWASDLATLDYPSLNFYATLTKSYLQSNINSVYKELEPIEMYKEAILAVDRAKMLTQSPGGHWVASRYNVTSGTLSHAMNHQACALGALFAVGLHAISRKAFIESEKELFRSGDVQLNFKHWSWANGLAEMCHSVASRTESGLIPAEFEFDTSGNLSFAKSGNFYSADIAETYFYLWRLTHNRKYRDYAWELTQNLIHHLRKYSSSPGVLHTSRVARHAVDDGASNSTTSLEQHGSDPHESTTKQQPPYLLGSTLKYLYLTLSEDTVISLDKWVFSSTGQPLPICGKIHIYSEDNCGRRH